MANDVQEWEVSTYQPWREALLRYCDLRQAEKKQQEVLDYLKSIGHELAISGPVVLNHITRLRQQAFEGEVKAYFAHVDAFALFRRDKKEECEPCVLHGAEVQE